MRHSQVIALSTAVERGDANGSASEAARKRNAQRTPARGRAKVGQPTVEHGVTVEACKLGEVAKVLLLGEAAGLEIVKVVPSVRKRGEGLSIHDRSAVRAPRHSRMKVGSGSVGQLVVATGWPPQTVALKRASVASNYEEVEGHAISVGW